MSERMYPIPFKDLMRWVMTERENNRKIFGIHKEYKADPNKTLPIFGEKIETPFGPAAGPNTQLSENIIAGYFTGARFFELKTVQKMDGEDLAKCIRGVCEDREAYARFSQGALERYRTLFTQEQMIEKCLNIYDKLWL